MTQYAGNPTAFTWQAQPYAFRQFQDLPSLVREVLTWGQKTGDLGELWADRRLADRLIEHFDVNQTMKIAELISIKDAFVMDPVKRSMVRCYVDCGEDMMRAKLTWTANY